MNITLDGFCDHTAMDVDDEIHEHYNELLRTGDMLIYGRTTYQLMESYWPTVVETPTGNKSMDGFAVLIDDLTKIVYSRTLQEVHWKNSILKKEINKEEILVLKQEAGKDMLVGSPGLIIAFLNLHLIDELQINANPVIVGKGLPLFKNIDERIRLNLIKTKTFACGAVLIYYKPEYDQ